MLLVAVHSYTPVLSFFPLVDIQPKEQQNAKDDRRNCHGNEDQGVLEYRHLIILCEVRTTHR
jgi:hypothetical protein